MCPCSPQLKQRLFGGGGFVAPVTGASSELDLKGFLGPVALYLSWE